MDWFYFGIICNIKIIKNIKKTIAIAQKLCYYISIKDFFKEDFYTMKKKILAFLVLAVTLLSAFPALASFPDMTDSSWDWARGAVDDMVEFGIIRGYSDNTFRPGNSVTKGEAMVLFSRVAGYTANGNEEYVEYAKKQYESVVSSLATPYTGEISYLIYKGILSEKNFLTYAADGVVNTPLKRYEAAEFLAKIASGNAALTGSATQLSFTDIAKINSTMAPYIKYVSENGIMLGMGDGSFDPEGTVTRAQITVMLSRIIPSIGYTYTDGKVKFYNSATNSIIITADDGSEQEFEIPDGVPVKLDGADADPEALLAGSVARITTSKDIVAAVETISPDYDAVVNGRFKKLEKIDKDTNGIVITDPTTGLTSTYALALTYGVKKDDKTITVTDLAKDDYVVLTVKSGAVNSIVAESKTGTVEGKVVNIELLPSYSMTVLTGGSNVKFELAENVTVMRNRKTATVEDVLVGDTVTLTTNYGVISNIVATSKTASVEGSLTALTISATPSITVTDASGNAYEYAIVKSPKITKNDVTKSFYDLRVGDKLKLSIDASTVTEINIVSSFANGADEGSSATVSGIVEYVNTAYGYIKLRESTELIFVSKASINDASGKSVALRSVTEGTPVTVFGTVKAGSYEASMVVIQG